jgi:cell division protein FtsQ
MYLQFVRALDAEGGHISSTLSEVDLSDPEDVRAIFVGGGRQPLVHFGDSDYLARYQAYQSHLTEWLQQYPALRSVDMRYGKQVVLDTGSVANTPQTADVALPSEASVDRAGPGGTSIPLVGTEKPLKKNGTSMPQRNTASVTMKKHISATRRGRRMPHAGKMRSRESRHAPQRGHTVRNPIMHVASGM